MLRRDFMPRAENAALEKRESRFHGVCVHIAMNIFPRVIDRLVDFFLHVIERPRIDGRLVSHNHFDVRSDVGIDNLPHRGRPCIRSANQSEIAIALPDANNYLLGILRTPAALFPRYVRLIYFDRAAQRFWRYVQHGRTDAMAEIPRCLVAHSKLALHLVGRHAFARLTEQIGRKKPLPEREMRVVEDGLCGYAKLVRAVIANKLIALENTVDLARAAFEALYAVLPAEAL